MGSDYLAHIVRNIIIHAHVLFKCNTPCILVQVLKTVWLVRP